MRDEKASKKHVSLYPLDEAIVNAKAEHNEQILGTNDFSPALRTILRDWYEQQDASFISKVERHLATTKQTA